MKEGMREAMTILTMFTFAGAIATVILAIIHGWTGVVVGLVATVAVHVFIWATAAIAHLSIWLWKNK